jgi:hypothetical protein
MGHRDAGSVGSDGDSGSDITESGASGRRDLRLAKISTTLQGEYKEHDDGMEMTHIPHQGHTS